MIRTLCVWACLGLGLQACDGGTAQGMAEPASAQGTMPATAAPAADPAATPPASPPPGTSPASPPPATKPPGGGGPFVTRSGQNLMVGNAPFRFLGVNHYQLAGGPATKTCTMAADPSQYAASVEALAKQAEAVGATVLRFWAFQSIAGPKGTDFSTMDRVIAAAKAHHLRLIPSLENHWKDCSQPSIDKTPQWYNDDYKRPYGYALSFPDYVRAIVSHYRDEPTIAMWQLLNEAESTDAPGLQRFTSSMAGLIKSIDKNHLVNLGTVACDQHGVSGPDFQALYAIDSIDVAEAHDYNQPMVAMPSCIANDIQMAQRLNKPLFIGESGIDVTTGFNPATRATLLAAKMRAAAAQKVSGYLLWSFGSPTGDGFAFDGTDPLAPLFTQISHAAGTAGFAPM